MSKASGIGSPARIAVVQHGDYLEARRRLAAGGKETYGSQRYSVDAQEQLIAHLPHIVFSLDGRPARVETEGPGEYITVPASMMRWVPARIDAYWRAYKILRRLERYSPTHLVLRTNDIIGCQMLAWANARKLPTIALLASRFEASHPPNQRFCKLANQSNVLFVGNHSRVATQSLIDCGLRAEKAIAWDFAQRIKPGDFAAKEPPDAGPFTVLFAGMMIEGKGIRDVVDAVQTVRRSGIDMRLTAYGEGPLRSGLTAHAGVTDGWLTFPGVVSIEQLTDAMSKSSLVVVPTRPEFPEAVNLVLMDALATRTPVAISDHPTFKAAFDGQCTMPFFQAGNAHALAELLTTLATTPDTYRSFSQQTSLAWQSLQIDCKFHELLERFAEESGIPPRAPCPNNRATNKEFSG
jgi:glycosyltransferase involved in cell wall biosynthesis